MEPFIAEFINNNKIPKIIRDIIVILICGSIITIGILCGLDSKIIIGNILGFTLAVLFTILGIHIIKKIHKGGTKW